MTAFALCLLALSDASFSGFRAHAGRDGRIVKRRSKANAAVTGAIAGIVALIALAVALLCSIALGLSTYDELSSAGSRMLTVYVVYATLIAAGFLAYFSPWLEVRTVATTLVLGPATFLRPLVITVGAAAAAAGSSLATSICAVGAAGTMLLIEPVLWRWFDRRQESTMVPFVAAPVRRGDRARHGGPRRDRSRR